MSTLSLIIKREFIAKVRNKSFIVMTFLSPLLVVGLISFVAFLATMKSDAKTVAVHDETGLFVKDFKNSDEYKFADFSSVDMKILKDSLIAESYEGIIFIPKVTDNAALQSKIQYISNDSPSMGFIADIQDIIGAGLTKSNYEQMGLDIAKIKNAEAKVNINLVKSSGEATIKGLNELKIGVGAAFGYLIMMFIIIYGNMVMRSVIEEKTNRIIEIIISSVKPFTLMMGKIIGTSLAGVLQFLIWAVIGGTLIFTVSNVFGIDTGAMSVTQPGFISGIFSYLDVVLDLPLMSLVVFFLLYFIGGYFLYSSIYASIGAAVDSETDSQQFLLPIILPLMLGVYVGFFSVLNDPHGTVAVVFSMIPLTSPIVMLMRIPFGVPWWELAISLTLLFATFLFVVWFAAKIYRVGILMYGKKPTYKELFKWLKY
ncbi:ABC transporter permease [Flavobacterium pallidum]|uniref:ABC transporter permease n=1 Tax=Flavobacterium pallidum TaxID=2172098 RepID=A0A2S1SHZ6_9FLAO|nr:ABC transporter permease [Flavobacterium pallidum]AWI26020.1 ABC transporter permease [Flavobacterium pallidum]